MGISRRAAIAAVSLLSAVSLAACGGSASNSSTGAASGAASASASSGEGKATGKVTVLAAASLQGAFEEIEKTVEKDNPGLDVTFDFQGSQDLVSSLAGGNSADVLATANNSTMKTAAEQKLVGDQTEFATNVLTLIVPKGNPKKITGLDSSLDGANLVICAPEVPCGEATQKLSSALGVTLNPASEEQKVTDVRGKVESGEADAGIVYTTDAAAAKDKADKIDIPDGGVVNHYPIAQTASPENAAGAKVFIDAVTGKTGQEVLAKYGFGKPGSAAAGASAGASSSAGAGTASSAAPSQAATAGGSASPEADKPTAETTAP
ncbi:molybdate ABC transporter substrate-binding protein [Actinomyces naeslundii]|uniref:Molybdate ABC transporter, periplasmic molybdate-binding protein n=2 Tax=Actinomyces naeslundii TaxID=1655 RepID=J2ZS73_ACTNH|nr:molybdate ABC transporter substrate-binding protein [Actinomyces naeslundii]EJN85405.1 molybdate ABC transporter, periplasmic molybdate-binding protein [Actinomyces naeslundii str. Howell 279]OMG33278.1 molybdate ABC transporter substrate-binding protein [Actinomyces naeslundii]QQC21390.1 molybdate ABC transporter substrate-binding protein [Actinomyces naeslundii]